MLKSLLGKFLAKENEIPSVSCYSVPLYFQPVSVYLNQKVEDFLVTEKFERQRLGIIYIMKTEYNNIWLF